MRDNLHTHAHDMSTGDLRDIDGVTAPGAGHVLAWDATRRLYVPGSVETNNLADESVTTAKIDDGAVTYAKLAWRESLRAQVLIAAPTTVLSGVPVTHVTLSFNTTQSSAILHCGFLVDCDITVASAGNFVNIWYSLDGGADVFTRLSIRMNLVDRRFVWTGLSLQPAAAGAHTLALKSNKNGAGGTAVIEGNTLIGDIIVFG